MMPFHAIAVAHPNILQSRLTWEIFRGTASDEYSDPTQFAQKTHETAGLKHLLSIIDGKLKGQSGDPVISRQLILMPPEKSFKIL